MKRRTLKVKPPQQGVTLAAFVAEQGPMPAADAQGMVEAGAVYLNGKRARRPAQTVVAGDAVVVVLEEGGRATLAPLKPRAALEVLLEDAWWVAVNKPAGVPAQPTASRVGEDLLSLVSGQTGCEAGLVHRLDKDTSGVTVFGKTKEATSRLAEQFRRGTLQKRYLAVVGPGAPAEQTVDLPLSKDPSRPGRYRASRTANGAPAQTQITRVFEGPDFCLLSLIPLTGRTHQLRAHLTALGFPIAGDKLYGGAPSLGRWEAPRCLLHAQRLTLAHPDSGLPVTLEAGLPDDLRGFFAASGVDPHRV